MLYTIIYALLTAVGIPGTLFAIGAGYMFTSKTGNLLGMILGNLCAYLGSVIGGVIAFVITKSVLRSWASKVFQAHRRVNALDRALSKQGVKLNLLLRVQPIIPTNVLNIMLGVTNTGLYEYVVGFLGLLPWNAFCVYIGSGIDDISDISSEPSSDENRGMYAVIFAIGGVMLLVTFFVLARHAQVALEGALADAESAEQARYQEALPLVI